MNTCTAQRPQAPPRRPQVLSPKPKAPRKRYGNNDGDILELYPQSHKRYDVNALI